MYLITWVSFLLWEHCAEVSGTLDLWKNLHLTKLPYTDFTSKHLLMDKLDIKFMRESEESISTFKNFLSSSLIFIYTFLTQEGCVKQTATIHLLLLILCILLPQVCIKIYCSPNYKGEWSLFKGLFIIYLFRNFSLFKCTLKTEYCGVFLQSWHSQEAEVGESQVQGQSELYRNWSKMCYFIMIKCVV